MSHREPLWFCHECGAETRPLMVPDPVCASCRGSFVEKMDNPSDDPREFGHPFDTGDLDSEVYIPALQSMLGMPPPRNFARDHRNSFGGRSETGSAPSLSFSVRNDTGVRTYTIGGSNTLGGRPPTMSEFHRRDFGADRHDSGIDGSLIAQYLMTVLGGPSGTLNEMLARGFGAEHGQMGDYVFNQEALDEIITQLMESNAHHPVPATEQIMKELPREVLVLGSSTLQKDCAVCKEQFSLETEDPDEQVVVTLPCSHPFHESCILPWLKSSGTCPVCRHQLIAQPEHHSQPGPSQTSGNNPRTASRSRSPAAGGDPTGFLQSLFGSSMRFDRSSAGGNPSSSSAPPDRRNSSSSRGGNHVPGGWDDLD